MFITPLDLYKLHIIVVHKDIGSEGVRDHTLLASAMNKPKQHFYYGNQDIFGLTVIVAMGIARNHPFIDGNKRTAFMAMDLFLIDNGYKLQKCDALHHTNMMVSLAQGELSQEQAIEYLKKTFSILMKNTI